MKGSLEYIARPPVSHICMCITVTLSLALLPHFVICLKDRFLALFFFFTQNIGSQMHIL